MASLNDAPEFASFLHNPWAFPSKVEKTAITATLRKYRFIGGTDPDKDLYDLLHKFFGNLNDLHKFGLVTHFNLMKDHVIKYKYIGLVLYGTNISHDNDILINKYQTNTGAVIPLTVKSITTRLITEYIKKENVEDLCRQVHNFDMYYTHIEEQEKAQKSLDRTSKD